MFNRFQTMNAMKTTTLKCCLSVLIVLLYKPASAAKFYWVGGTGLWSDFTNHWSSTSGGAPDMTSQPGFVDSVYFDISSFSAPGQEVTVDAPLYDLSMLMRIR
jgi:hypothetical protein